MIVVKNTQPNVKVFGHPGAESITLLPGLNYVNETLWEKLTKGHKLVEFMIEEGTIEVLGDKPLTKYTAPKAIKAVKEVYDRKLLNELKSTEKREPVLAAIEAQLESVKVTSKKADE